MKKEFLILTALLSVSLGFSSGQGFSQAPFQLKDPVSRDCKNGKEQSPININFPSVNTIKKLKGFGIEYKTTPFLLVHTGHTLEANAVVKTNKLSIDTDNYKLTGFHFHGPSDHQLNGQDFPLELHLVHQAANGKFSILGVMVKEGIENEALKEIRNQLANEKNAAPISVDLPALLPANKTFFHYSGSLTIPPCTENVKWVIFENPIEMSKEQILAFKQKFSLTNRPIQPLNNREIQYGVFEEKK